jgi:hypothetical protein
MSDQWDEWRQDAAGIIVETAGVDEVASKAAPKAAPVETAEYVEIPPEVEAEERALIVSTAQAPQQHLVVGVGALAAMDDAAFERNLASLEKGQQRLEILTDKLLVRGQDYGTVPGIKKPFLQKPGSEKLANFYGLAIRFEAERVEGDGVVTPPLAYHVKSFAHLGSFDGPVVAQGYGEANSFEPRYRYIEAKRVCPACNHEGLIKGKIDGKLKGKWWCSARDGGCNKTFEAADPSVTDQNTGKVDNPDPYGLANTLVKMGEKRAHVDVVLRATGTSGFFSQDEDSPSVQAQASHAPSDGDERPEVENVTGQQSVQRGGRPDAPTPQQMAQLSALSKEKKLGPDGIAAVIVRLFDVPVSMPEDWTRGEKGKWLWKYIEDGFSADQVGSLLSTIDTGEVPEKAAAS